MNPSYQLSPYLYSFMYAMTYRYSCYDCKFAKVPRQGDITLADYWGVKEFFPQIDVHHGVSLVLVNTETGKRVWELVKEACIYYQSNIADGAKFNGNLVHKSEKPSVRDGIYKRIDVIGYKKVAETIFKSPDLWKIRIIYFIKGRRLLNGLLNKLKAIKCK